jgi:prepilin-type N-terminal cleavage/methylation domain-containing protein
MPKFLSSGYTLVELTLVMAITSLLAAAVFEGQLALRTQAQFDADVDKIVTSIAQARDEATSGINSVGNGTGLGDDCVGGTPPAVFAGSLFSADNALPGGPFEITFYEANPNPVATATACPFGVATSIDVPSGVTMASASGGEAFVRTSVGGVDACPTTGVPLATVVSYFAQGACPVGTWTLSLKDSDGHVATIQVDQSGLAKRLN